MNIASMTFGDPEIPPDTPDQPEIEPGRDIPEIEPGTDQPEMPPVQPDEISPPDPGGPEIQPPGPDTV